MVAPCPIGLACRLPVDDTRYSSCSRRQRVADACLLRRILVRGVGESHVVRAVDFGHRLAIHLPEMLFGRGRGGCILTAATRVELMISAFAMFPMSSVFVAPLHLHAIENNASKGLGFVVMKGSLSERRRGRCSSWYLAGCQSRGEISM